jgi:hypothetical protein
MSGSRMDQPERRYEPPTFVPVGLADDVDWVIDRWFLGADGLYDHPASGLTLGYSTPASSRRVLVCTEATRTNTPAELIAMSAMALVVNGAGPRPSTGMDVTVADLSSWVGTSWQLDGNAIEAFIQSDTDVWCGFSAQPAAGYAVSVAGTTAVAYSDLSLSSIRSAAGYNVDFFGSQPARLIYETPRPAYLPDAQLLST